MSFGGSSYHSWLHSASFEPASGLTLCIQLPLLSASATFLFFPGGTPDIMIVSGGAFLLVSLLLLPTMTKRGLSTQDPPAPRLTNLFMHAQHLTIRVKSSNVYDTLFYSDLSPVFSTLKSLRSLKSLTLRWFLPRVRGCGSNRLVLALQEFICSCILTATGGTLEQLIIHPTISDSVVDLSGHRVALPPDIVSSFVPRCFMEIKTLKKFGFAFDKHGRNCRLPDCVQKAMKADVWRIVKNNPGIEELLFKDTCPLSTSTLELLAASCHTPKRLSLHGIKCPLIINDAFQFRDLMHLMITTLPSHAILDNLWSTLLAIGTKSLTSTQVTPSFVNFLNSFTGSKTLIIASLRRESRLMNHTSPTSLSVLGREFFTGALLRHAPTLQHFSVSFALEVYIIPGWTYTPCYFISNFARMSSLRHLALHPSEIRSEKVDLETTISAYQAIPDGIDECDSIELDSTKDTPQTSTSAGPVSSLEFLEIHWPEERFINTTDHEKWLAAVGELLDEVISEAGVACRRI
ncbi:hypothetical protein AX16_004510 [Volvariella volvacea WC 439]|nr:hypothetical protein AX16_004510 [Volvariella volvacea WC 439]